MRRARFSGRDGAPRHPLYLPCQLANQTLPPKLPHLPPMPKPDKNDIERLSRGESTRGKIGNRGVGHRLTQKERILFEAAKRNGFLKIPVTGIRKNVINIYRLWCQASSREFITK